jgi:GH15 family glucan-1,4-alpha-glucosidase
MEIRDLGLIGDRRTAALVTSCGEVVWYCPGRFDAPSLFGRLLDDEAGVWMLGDGGDAPVQRAYKGDSAVLDTQMRGAAGAWSVTDFMPLGEDCPRGLCRVVTPPAQGITARLRPAPGYGAHRASLQRAGDAVCIDNCHWLYASVPPHIDGDEVRIEFEAGCTGWMALLDREQARVTLDDVRRWEAATLREWRAIASRITYRGPYEAQVAASLRALRLLTHVPSGGIVAAATTSLPEIPGGRRNYDYRYVWLRDAAMIVSALVRAGSSGPDERAFLSFLCDSAHRLDCDTVLPPFLTLGQNPAPGERDVDLAGHADSRPVRIGNDARDQLQLDGLANVLLAAKLIYSRHDTREHWDTVARIADFLAAHWREPDYGIWEEHAPRQYTTGKVTVSCALRYLAEFSRDEAQRSRWCEASDAIDAFVHERCMTPGGAYAAFEGADAVDVSAALYPAWGYVDADCPAMCATMRALEQRYCRDDLYWRHLEELGPFEEGAFLAGTLWVAQYWILRGDLARGRRILDAALRYANDLGLFAEEADPDSGRMLGNLPQTFVHASLVGAAVDLRDALDARGRD